MGRLTIFTRIGGKNFIREKIVKMFPESYTTYIEPFIGGGQVLMELLENEYNPKVEYVGNDLNKDIYDIWNDTKKVNPETMRRKDWSGNKSKFNHLKESKPTSPEERLYRNLYISYYSYGGTREGYADKGAIRGGKFLNNLEEIQEKMKKVKILNEDYRKVISKYDNVNAVIYLDPPYTNKEKLYEGNGISPVELAKVCRSIKGKFILSYDICKEVREAFKGFNFYKAKLKYTAGENKHYKNEYIITNFKVE